MVPRGAFRIELVEAVQCSDMSQPIEVMDSIEAAVHSVHRSAGATQQAAKHVRLAFSSITIGVESQFSHANSVRNEAWLCGALWCWSRAAFQGVSVDIQRISGQSRLKLPKSVCKSCRKLPPATGMSKGQRRTMVKAFAQGLVDQMFAERTDFVDLALIEPWYRSLTSKECRKTRQHDAVDALLLMMVLAGRAGDAATRSVVTVRRVQLPAFSGPPKFCKLTFA